MGHLGLLRKTFTFYFLLVALIVGMGLQFVVMFIDSFMGDVIYVRDVEVCVERVICYIPGVFGMALRILGCDLHDDCVGLAGTISQFYSLVPYGFNYSSVDEYFVFYR